jgi:hypothetical protein
MPDDEKLSFLAFVKEMNLSICNDGTYDNGSSASTTGSGAYATKKPVPVEFHFGPDGRPVYEHILTAVGNSEQLKQRKMKDGSFVIVTTDPATAEKVQKAIRNYQPVEEVKLEPEQRQTYAGHVRVLNFEHGLNTGALPYPKVEELR